MAPMTRGNRAIIPRSESSRPPQTTREASWQLVEQPDNRPERDLSEEPPSSYDEEQDMMDGLGEEDLGDAYLSRRIPLTTADDDEEVLHPLREAAHKVGNEIERFAEILDSYNPHIATDQEERQGMMFDIIELYRGIAVETAKGLRKKHGRERNKGGARRTTKFRGYSAPQDEDEMEIEDSDERDTPDADAHKKGLHDLNRWEQEAQTWDLLQRLIDLRLRSAKLSASSRRTKVTQYSSDREIWDSFLDTDGLALERKTILQWLKDTAEESGEEIDVLVEDFQKKADRGEIIAHGWLHTKAAIKAHKRKSTLSQALDPRAAAVDLSLLNSSRTEPLVTQLDPDSATRQKRTLEPSDEYFERSIWLGCYEMLRRGRSSKDIRVWCLDRTEPWRAASILGFPDENEEDDTTTIPDALALWRRMCYALARRGGGDEYERAVYGILCGDILSVEPICKSWDDYVFVHYNALLRTQFDSYLRSCRPQSSIYASSSFGAFDAVQFHGDNQTAGKRLIETLKTDARKTRETMQPMKMLQGVLIADDFSNFIYQQGLSIAKQANANSPSKLFPPNKQVPENEGTTGYILLEDHDNLRVLAHILIIFKGLGINLGGVFRETEVENTIVAYISLLRLAGKEELVPLYCSQLSGARKYATLCRNLIDVTNYDQRLLQIKLMRGLGLDVQTFVTYQARFLLQDYPDETLGYPAAESFKILLDIPGTDSRKVRSDFMGEEEITERTDLLLIRSLEWYLLVDGLWSETFAMGTLLYLRFYKNMHLIAARALREHIRASDIALRKTPAILGESMDFNAMEFGEEEDLTEVLDGSADEKRLLKKYLVAEAKSYRELEILVEMLDALDTISSLQELGPEDMNVNKAQWKGSLIDNCSTAKTLGRVLVRGWLTTSQRPAALTEFTRLREVYLPETFLAYLVNIQYGGENLTRDFLMEAMDISATIAEDGSDVLDLFMRTGRMQELVDALAQASKTLLFVSSRHGSSSRKKKALVKGWTPNLWNVK